MLLSIWLPSRYSQLAYSSVLARPSEHSRTAFLVSFLSVASALAVERADRFVDTRFWFARIPSPQSGEYQGLNDAAEHYRKNNVAAHASPPDRL
jgi:hypothetical protein